MLRSPRWVAVVGLAVWLLQPLGARAGWLFDWGTKPKCPPPSYTHFHYGTPTAYRVYAYFHNPKIPQYQQDRYPQLPLAYRNTPYPCPPVDPALVDSPYNLGR